MTEQNSSTAEYPFPGELVGAMNRRDGLYVAHFDEDRADLVVLGHPAPAAARAAMDAEERLFTGLGLAEDPDLPVGVETLEQCWGVLEHPEGAPANGWWLNYGHHITAATRGAFPLTVLAR